MGGYKMGIREEIKETKQLVVSKRKEQHRYHFKKMFDYCEQNNKKIEELAPEEKQLFIVKKDDELE